MANVTIYEKIEQKGLQDARKIQEAGSKKALELEFAILDEAKKQIEQAEKKHAQNTAVLLKTKETEFEQAVKQISLACKKDLINQAFSRAHAGLKKVSKKEWEKLIVKMLGNDELIGDEVILASAHDRDRFLSSFTSDPTAKPIVLDQLNALLHNKKYHLTLSESVSPVDGGFFVLGSDFDIDHSYATLLSELKDKEESNIASQLFDGCE